MSAIEYVKKNGIDKSKIHLDRMKQERWINSFFNDLKQIVDAWELVFEHGSIERAKKYADSTYTAPEIKDVLVRAISLVEQCQ